MQQPNRTDQAPAGTISVLVVSPYAEDHRALANIFAHTNWTVMSADNCNDALRILSTTPVAVVICEYCTGDRSWRDLNAGIEALHTRTRLVVTSRNADDRMWAEILNEGGYDCLLKPFHKEEVLRLVSLAWQSWTAATRMHVRSARAAAATTSIAC